MAQTTYAVIMANRGPTGQPGKSILIGDSAPENSLGNNGDVYLNPAAGEIYGPKASGAWPAGVALTIPANASAISAEVTRAEAAETVNASAISAEVTRAQGAETANASAISAEVTRAEAAETANASAISAEVTRAQGAEAGCEQTANKNVAGGYAGLDSTGHLFTSQVPFVAVVKKVVDSEAEMFALAGTAGFGEGDIASRDDLTSSPTGFVYIYRGTTTGTIADWSGPIATVIGVVSVNGHTDANVTVTEADLASHTGTGTLVDDLAANASAISAEATRAEAAETANASAISAEQARAEAAEASVRVEKYQGVWEGVPAASEVGCRENINVAVTLTTTGALATADVAATATATFNIVARVGSTETVIGTVVFAASATTGTITITTPALAVGAVLKLVAPATPDSTLAGIGILITGSF